MVHFKRAFAELPDLPLTVATVGLLSLAAMVWALWAIYKLLCLESPWPPPWEGKP